MCEQSFHIKLSKMLQSHSQNINKNNKFLHSAFYYLDAKSTSNKLFAVIVVIKRHNPKLEFNLFSILNKRRNKLLY